MYNLNNQTMNRYQILISAVVTLLTLPLVGTIFNWHFNWDAFDFLVGFILLFSAVSLIELFLRFVKTTRWRVVLISLVLFLLLVVWAELAVGLFGSPWAGS